ncbi:MAG: tRNA uridine-5-carboxymethylaminomethyl(34) synthesis GTPase MnmE [Nitrospirae bacterium]|nr:tRNA uridine-5-carboxymethylaminomethyl(34) synthesis GTPase MnmE [Nitrospirota bacterium]
MDETICAIATPVGEGGIGIVRLSGDRAIPIASYLVRLRSGKPLSTAKSFLLHYADLVEPVGSETAPGPASQESASPFDESLVVVMRAPRSYTREDVVEIHCHGGPLILKRVCQGLLRCGARLAQPGEFTKRAFLNGRLDLAQAEAVLDTIRAKTEAALTVAQTQLRGSLSTQAHALRDRLIALLAEVEAGIDFVEEDLPFVGREALASGLQEAERLVTRWLATAQQGRVLREGMTTAIIGRPNVGKSSLLNALVQTDRAIVTPIPGTTRDVLEEYVNVRGIPLRLLDTAGLRETEDPVEQEGVRRTRTAIDRAELVVLVLDSSQPPHADDLALLDQLSGTRGILVLNKSDLPRQLHELDLPLSHPGPLPIVSVSALTGQGLDELRSAIWTLAAGSPLEPTDMAAITRLRHGDALSRVRQALQQAQESVTAQAPQECVALDLRQAIDGLEELTGVVTTDEILDRIFSEFCIGK